MCEYVTGCLGSDFSHVSLPFLNQVMNMSLTIDRTGMHVIAATFLLPVGVSIYTFVGGIKATLVSLFLIWVDNNTNIRLDF